MEFDSVVTDGRVVLDVGAAIPNGTPVRVTVSPTDPSTPRREPTLKWMAKFSGVIDDMPSDFAAQHDHYLHGTPKR